MNKSFQQYKTNIGRAGSNPDPDLGTGLCVSLHIVHLNLCAMQDEAKDGWEGRWQRTRATQAVPPPSLATLPLPVSPTCRLLSSH